MSFKTLSICECTSRKIIDISKLCFDRNYKLPIRYFHKTQIYNNFHFVKSAVKFVISTYDDYDFWWFEHAECAKLKSQTQFFKKVIVDTFSELGKSNQLYFVDNDMYPTKYEEIGFKFSSYPMMFGFTYEHIIKIEARKFDKKFICLNRMDKRHRRTIFDYMNDNYKSDSYLSFSPMDSTNSRFTQLDSSKYVEMGSTLSAFTSAYQITSFCNIITETNPSNTKIHITEKTDKCFSAGQPFILVAGPNYLKTLHEYGFKTFDKWWDESYDSEENLDIRISIIKKI